MTVEVVIRKRNIENQNRFDTYSKIVKKESKVKPNMQIE